MDSLRETIVQRASMVRSDLIGLGALDAIAVCAAVVLVIIETDNAPPLPSQLMDYHAATRKFVEVYRQVNAILRAPQ